jgi:hypothetical protein
MLPRPRVSQPRPSCPSPFLESAPTHSLPSPSCTLRRTPSPSLSLCAHSCGTPPKLHRRSVAIVERLPRPLPRWAPTLRQQRGTPFGLPPAPLFHPVHAHWRSPRAAGAPPPSTRGSPTSSSLLKRSRVSSRGEQPPVPLFPRLLRCPLRNCSPEQVSAAVGPLRRSLRPLVPPHRCHAHDRVRRATLNPPVPFWASQRAPACSRPRLRQASAVDASGATTGNQGTWPELAVRSELSV